jgi:hypothetical protein
MLPSSANFKKSFFLSVHKSDLIHMRVQQNPGGILFSGSFYGDHVSKRITRNLVSVRPEQLGDSICRGDFKS